MTGANFAERFERLVTAAGLPWQKPHTAETPWDDEFSYEWWYGKRKITVYEGKDAVELISVWGHNVDTEMSYERDPSDEELVDAWRWLCAG